MIVKVQLALTGGERQVLIYDKDRQFLIEGPVTLVSGLEAAMGDRVRAFFEVAAVERLDPGCQRLHEATVVHRRDCGCTAELAVGELLPEQGW